MKSVYHICNLYTERQEFPLNIHTGRGSDFMLSYKAYGMWENCMFGRYRQG